MPWCLHWQFLNNKDKHRDLDVYHVDMNSFINSPNNSADIIWQINTQTKEGSKIQEIFFFLIYFKLLDLWSKEQLTWILVGNTVSVIENEYISCHLINTVQGLYIVEDFRHLWHFFYRFYLPSRRHMAMRKSSYVWHEDYSINYSL